MGFRLRTTGLKAHDIDIEIGQRLLLLGPTGAGKSTFAQALTILALGYDPSLGKTEAATCQLMRGREMIIQGTFADGRWLRREFRLVGEGQYESVTRCSWVSSKKNDEHHQAIILLFGADETDAAENLVPKELHRVSGPKRAAKLLAMMETGAAAIAVAKRTARFWLQGLAGVSDDHMPDDHLQLRNAIDGYDPKGTAHTGLYAVVREATPLMVEMVKGGVGAALDWAREQATAAQASLREKKSALGDHQARLGELGPVDGDRIAALEQSRSELERQIGATQERRTADTAKAETIASAKRELDTATTTLQAAKEAMKAAEAKHSEIDNKRTLLKGVVDALDKLTAPTPPPAVAEAQALVVARGRLKSQQEELDAITAPAPADYSKANAIDTSIHKLETALEQIVLPEISDDQRRRIVEAEVVLDALKARQSQAESGPHRTMITALATFKAEFRALKSRTPGANDLVDRFCEAQHARLLEAMGDDNPSAISRAIDAAEADLEAARHLDAGAAGIRDEKLAERNTLSGQIEALHREFREAREQADRVVADAKATYDAKVKAARTQRDLAAKDVERLEGEATTQTESVSSTYTKAQQDYETKRKALTGQRDRFTAELDALVATDDATVKALDDATAAYEAAEQRLEDLDANVAGSEGTMLLVADLEAELATVQEEINAHARRAVAVAEIERLVAETAAAEAKRVVYARLGDALARVRGEELSHAGGPLAERMHRFLVGAGRSEAPYIFADKLTCAIGWQTTEGARVSINALSGGEAALFGTAFADAVAAIRKPEVRVMLCEAAELDDDTIGQLLKGIDTVADGAFYVVMSSHTPRAIPQGWVTLTLERESAQVAA